MEVPMNKQIYLKLVLFWIIKDNHENKFMVEGLAFQAPAMTNLNLGPLCYLPWIKAIDDGLCLYKHMVISLAFVCQD